MLTYAADACANFRVDGVTWHVICDVQISFFITLKRVLLLNNYCSQKKTTVNVSDALKIQITTQSINWRLLFSCSLLGTGECTRTHAHAHSRSSVTPIRGSRSSSSPFSLSHDRQAVLRGPSAATAEGRRRPSVMYLIYSVALCLTFIHRARGLPWYEEKVSLVGRGFLTMLWFWHVEMQILLLQVSKCLQMQKETTHSTFLWITCSTELDYSSIIGSEDNYFKKEKKRQSNSPFFSLCCISSLLQITSSPKETIEKRLFYKRRLSLICRFSQHVPVFAWPFLYLIYVAPRTSSPGCYGSTAVASDSSSCRSWYL